jgi:hypothetical protein
MAGVFLETIPPNIITHGNDGVLHKYVPLDAN